MVEAGPERERLQLPNLCGERAVFLICLVAELVAILAALVRIGVRESFWIDLAALSLLLQWLALGSAATLCLLRTGLARLQPWQGYLGALLAVLAVVYLTSEAAWWAVHALGIQGEVLSETRFAFVARNLAIGAVVTALLLHYIDLQQAWRRQVEREARARLQALQARIRPHFLFNALNTSLALIRTRPLEAERALEDLAELFRAAMQDADALVPLAEELALVRQYLAIEQLRLGERLRVEWRTDGLPAIRVPRLIVQPLAENAVFHGIEPRADGGRLSIVGEATPAGVVLTIENPLEQEAVRGAQLALDNVRERLALAFAGRARLEVEPGPDSFRVRLFIPF